VMNRVQLIKHRHLNHSKDTKERIVVLNECALGPYRHGPWQNPQASGANYPEATLATIAFKVRSP